MLSNVGRKRMCTAAARRPTSKTHSNFEARTKSRSTQVGLTEEDGKGGGKEGKGRRGDAC